MRKYNIEEIPPERRTNYFDPPTYSVYDNDGLFVVAIIQIEERGTRCSIRFTKSERPPSKCSLQDAFLSITNDTTELDMPDELIEMLNEQRNS
jgi:hypothetical protein